MSLHTHNAHNSWQIYMHTFPIHYKHKYSHSVVPLPNLFGSWRPTQNPELIMYNVKLFQLLNPHIPSPYQTYIFQHTVQKSVKSLQSV